MNQSRKSEGISQQGKSLEVGVYYEDTDFSGRVCHAPYLRFFERGRTEWLRGRGFERWKLEKNCGVVLAVRSLQIDYYAPALMDDLLKVETEMFRFPQSVVSVPSANLPR